MYQSVHNVDSLPDTPGADAPPSEIPRRLPRGTHGLDRSLVAASQRTRLLEAVGRAVADKGYSATTIEHIVRDAGVSKKTFYEHFTDKLDCFLAAYEAASDELLEHVRAAQEAAAPEAAGTGGSDPVGTGGSDPVGTGGSDPVGTGGSDPVADGRRTGGADPSWLARTRAGIHAYLRWLAAEPALARVFLIEIAAAGPQALELRERMRDRYADRMRELQTAGEVPDEIFHAVVAGADDLVVRRLREGGDLLELEPALLYLQVSLLS
jgi:AcrR family transcriptional regulator